MSTSFRLLLPRQIHADMIAQAQAELPNECCGLLAGRSEDNGSATRIVARYPLVNAAASPIEFLSDPQSMFAAHRDMRRQGLDVVAIYHSHPSSAAVPSRTDRERNYSPDVMNVIISLQGSEPVVKGWFLSENDQEEAVWELV